MADEISLPNWPHAFGGPTGRGIIRQTEADFKVDELLGFEPSGSGEHVFLRIEKRGENTAYVARELARFAGVHNRDIGYAGLKDRHAVTRQWFSVWLPGKADPDWSAVASDNIKVLQVARHNKKLKRGVLLGNYFKLQIRAWQGDKELTLQKLESIKSHGIANYFGAQRFGREGQNINKALLMFQGQRVKRQQRSLYLSAVRAFLFNEILASRIRNQNWQTGVAGDTFIFDKAQQYFKSEHIDADIQQRLNDRVIHASGCLFGSGNEDNTGAALVLETQVLQNYADLTEGLIKADVSRSRRPLRVNVEELQYLFNDTETLSISFFLPAGSYATSLLREVVDDDIYA